MAREKEWRKAQLAAAPNWTEQVSMADQIHMQRGSKERERDTSKIAGQARRRRRRGGGRRAGGREAGHTPAVTASL